MPFFFRKTEKKVQSYLSGPIQFFIIKLIRNGSTSDAPIHFIIIELEVILAAAFLFLICFSLY